MNTMRTAWAVLFVVLLTVLHGLIVVGATLSLPLILMYPWTRTYYLMGIGILLVSWALFADCPLTTIDRKVRAYLRWPQLKEDFTAHYLSMLTGLRVSQRAHRYVERAYLLIVIAIILAR